MQLMEKVRDGEKNGKIFGERSIQLIQSPLKKPVNIKGSIIHKDKSDLLLEGSWQNSSPDDKSRFEKIVYDKQVFTLIVYPFHELKPDLAKVGWITSAFLLAFYALGYRYILQEAVMPVRRFILRSFINEREIAPLKDEIVNFELKEYGSKFFKDPKLQLIIPLDGKNFVHLEINYLTYQISLPISIRQNILNHYIFTKIPDLSSRIADLIKEETILYIPIECKDIKTSDNDFDYFLGKPL